MDVEMVQEFSGMPRILSRYEIDFFQDAGGPEGHVFEVADRGGNDVEGSGHARGGLLSSLQIIPDIIVNG
jgi:hypothetical protein